jgi:hypothetical protein
MLNLHASWLAADAGHDAALALWAEGDTPPRRKDLRSTAAVPLHPFAATHSALRGVLAHVEFSGALQNGEAIALLPSRDGAPIASFAAEAEAEAQGEAGGDSHAGRLHPTSAQGAQEQLV